MENWPISQNCYNCSIKKIQEFSKFKNLEYYEFFFNFIIWKINILHYQKLLNILGVQIVSKKYEKSSQIKWSNNLSFFILIFVISKFRNSDRSTFRRSQFWPPPNCSYFFFNFVHMNVQNFRYVFHVTEVPNVQMNEIRKKKIEIFCAGFLQTVKTLTFIERKSNIFLFFKGLTTL